MDNLKLDRWADKLLDTGKSEQSGDFIAFGVIGKCHIILYRPMLYSSAG